VNVEAVMKTLITRGLVEESGLEHETGAILYRTTSFFLERLGLNSLDDLPALAPYLPNLEALDDILDSLTE
jgi:segregation and condensation protein B